MQSIAALLAIVLSLGVPALAQDQQVQFNQVVNLNGDVIFDAPKNIAEALTTMTDAVE